MHAKLIEQSQLELALLGREVFPPEIFVAGKLRCCGGSGGSVGVRPSTCKGERSLYKLALAGAPHPALPQYNRASPVRSEKAFPFSLPPAGTEIEVSSTGENHVEDRAARGDGYDRSAELAPAATPPLFLASLRCATIHPFSAVQPGHCKPALECEQQKSPSDRPEWSCGLELPQSPTLSHLFVFQV